MNSNLACGHTKYTFLLLSFFVFANCNVTKEISKTNTQIETVRLLCLKNFNKNHYPGIAISVSKNGKTIYSEGIGLADIEAAIPVDPQLTLFRIGSISKAITSIALAQLVEAGKLDLDEPVQTYVPYFPEKKYPVTVRQLALHTAGIRHYKGLEFMLNLQYNSVEEGIAIFKDDPLLFEPGTNFEYSSYGWNLLSAAIEGASQKDFLTYMEENVFNHPSMACLQAENVYTQIEDIVQFYQLNNENKPIVCMSVNNSYKWASGGFLSCSEDIMDFGVAVLENDWISAKTRDEFWTKGKLSNGEEAERGLGWAQGVDEFGNHWVGHSGGSMGGSSMLAIYPEQNLVVAMLINLSAAKWEGLPFKVANIFIEK